MHAITRADPLVAMNACVSRAAVALQLMSVSDVSKPSYADGGGKDRLLVLKLHDGRTSCKALEHKPCPGLSDSMAPGSKVTQGRGPGQGEEGRWLVDCWCWAVWLLPVPCVCWRHGMQPNATVYIITWSSWLHVLLLCTA